MAGLGYGSMFNMDPNPNPYGDNVPATGAMLNESGQPEWEDSMLPENNPFPLPEPLPTGIKLPAVGKLERLQQIDELLVKLTKERTELIDDIENILNGVKEKNG